MAEQLDIPEELLKILSHSADLSSRPTWSIQTVPGYTTVKLTWIKGKNEVKTKAQKRKMKRRGGELTHPPTRVVVPASADVVPDPPETAPALARPTKAKRQTPSTYRRNQRRYWEWRKEITRKEPLIPGPPEIPITAPTGPVCDTQGEPDALCDPVLPGVVDGDPDFWTASPVIHTPHSPAFEEEDVQDGQPRKKRKKNKKKKPDTPTPQTYIPGLAPPPTPPQEGPLEPTLPPNIQQQREIMHEKLRNGEIASKEDFLAFMSSTFNLPDVTDIVNQGFENMPSEWSALIQQDASSEMSSTPKSRSSKQKGKGGRRK